MHRDHHAGTPHTFHYQNAVDAIKAGKHVLVEKPATTNAEEFRSLIDLAAKHGVFLMEAMWTRFQPIALAIKRVIDEGRIGAPVLVHADLSGDFDIESGYPSTVSSTSHPQVCLYRPTINTPHPRSKARRRCNLGLVSRFVTRARCCPSISDRLGDPTPLFGYVRIAGELTLVHARSCRLSSHFTNTLQMDGSNPRSLAP